MSHRYGYGVTLKRYGVISRAWNPNPSPAVPTVTVTVPLDGMTPALLGPMDNDPGYEDGTAGELLAALAKRYRLDPVRDWRKLEDLLDQIDNLMGV